MLFDAFDLLQLKAVLLLAVRIFRVVDLAEKHLQRPVVSRVMRKIDSGIW